MLQLIIFTPPLNTMRHDLKQHSIFVLSLLEKQQYTTAEEYLKNLTENNEDSQKAMFKSYT